MKHLPVLFIAFIGCYLSSVVAAPYEVKTQIFADEFEDKQDTTYTLVGNRLSDVKNCIYVEIKLTKYVCSDRSEPFFTFKFGWYALFPPRIYKFGKNLILSIDGEKQIFHFSVSEYKQSWRERPNIEVCIDNHIQPGFIANIAFAKDVKVRIKKEYGDPITGYLDENAIRNIRCFYEEYVIEKTQTK